MSTEAVTRKEIIDLKLKASGWDIADSAKVTQEYCTAQPMITLGQLRAFEILLPSEKLQTQFAQIVEKTKALKSQYQQSLQELENLYGSLSQRAFRGS